MGFLQLPRRYQVAFSWKPKGEQSLSYWKTSDLVERVSVSPGVLRSLKNSRHHTSPSGMHRCKSVDEQTNTQIVSQLIPGLKIVVSLHLQFLVRESHTLDGPTPSPPLPSPAVPGTHLPSLEQKKSFLASVILPRLSLVHVLTAVLGGFIWFSFCEGGVMFWDAFLGCLSCESGTQHRLRVKTRPSES